MENACLHRCNYLLSFCPTLKINGASGTIITLYFSIYHMSYKYLCEGYKLKTNQYSNKTYIYGPNETTLAITIPRISVVKTVERKEICKRKCKGIISLEERLLY